MVKKFKKPSTKSFKKVPEAIDRSLPFIKVLLKSKGKINKTELLQKFPDFVTDDITEMLYNIVMGHIPVKTKQVKKLKAFKKPLLKLVNLKNNKKRKRFIYKQKGGFIGTLLPIIASLVGGILPNVV